MIRLKSSSLALHSCDVPGHKYIMDTTWLMPKKAQPLHVVNWILTAAGQSPDLYLRNVVINAHGCPGKIYIGGDGQPTLSNYNVGVFEKLKGHVGTIWIIACKVAAGGVGKYFCESMAKAAGAQVVAADVNQYVEGKFYWNGCPPHHIDYYEGNAYMWDASGKMELCPQNCKNVPTVES